MSLISTFSVSKFIRIGIADKNDNPPYFDKSLYEAEVDENEDIQHTVLTVTAELIWRSERIAPRRPSAYRQLPSMNLSIVREPSTELSVHISMISLPIRLQGSELADAISLLFT